MTLGSEGVSCSWEWGFQEASEKVARASAKISTFTYNLCILSVKEGRAELKG